MIATTAPDPTREARSMPRGAVPVGIAGLGAALPAGVVTNDDLAARGLDTSDDWIRTRTGIVTRREAGPDDTTTSLATSAARLALARSGRSAAEVDVVVVATVTPDRVMPGCATRVAAALGSEAGAFDVNAACSGFIAGLGAGTGMIAAGLARTVLVVGAETLTRRVDPTDRATVPLFADGAGAALLAAGAGSVGPFDLGSDGHAEDLLFMDPHIQMQGREVYRRAVAAMTASALRTLAAAGLDADDIDLVVPHQANLRIIDAVARRLGVDDDRVLVTVDHHGNTSAASIPLALEEAASNGRLTAGDRILLVAFGAGLTWGSTLLVWDPEGTP